MPNCHAETIAVGGSSNGCAEEASCSAIAMATARSATCSVESALGVESISAESEAGSLSAVNAVSMTIINHSKRIAPKTSPMLRAVICRESVKSFMITPEYSRVCVEGLARIYHVTPKAMQ